MIICCGEALIDMIPRQMPDGCIVYYPLAGGSVFNTTIALGRLGEETSYFGGLSTDVFGQLLSSKLSEANVHFSPSAVSDRPTTLAFIELNDGEASYTFYDEGSAGRMLDAENLPNIGGNVKAMHFGAISLIPEPCGSTFEALLKREAPKRVISLDPNIRPNFIYNKNSHRERISRMIASSDIVKVSVEDLSWIRNSRSAKEIIEEWLSDYSSVVALTKGSEGVDVYTKTGKIHVEAQEVNVVDTVGAGDAFNAGLLSALNASGWLSKNRIQKIDSEVLREPVEFACRVAALTISKAGADAPWRDKIQNI